MHSDQHSDATGQAHLVPTLNACEYDIEWDDGGIPDATTYLIAELSYNMCDNEGNRVLVFNVMVAHRRCLTANTHADQKLTHQRGKVQ